jgi:hypothetical protein
MRKTAVVVVFGILITAALAHSRWCGKEPFLAIGGTAPGNHPGAVTPPDSRAILDRIRHKQRIVDALLAGRLTELDAIARFRTLNADSPGTLAMMRRQWPGVSEEELSRRNLELYLQTTLRSRHAVEASSPKVEEEVWD